MEPSDLERSKNRQAWEWLFDLRARLDVAVELVDDRHLPLFPAGLTGAAGVLRLMLKSGEPALTSAISGARLSTRPIAVSVDGLQAICLGLSHDGVLLVARERTGDELTGRCQDLESIGSWLATAVEEALSEVTGGVAEQAFRVTSLQRLFADAVARGSIRAVIGAFVEVLGVWDDVVTRAYTAAASGGFVQYVSPVGAPFSLPANLHEALVPADCRIRRLSPAHVDRLGLPPDGPDVFIRRIFITADCDCVLVFSGQIDEGQQDRLSVYAELLRGFLVDALSTTTERAIDSVAQPDIPSKDVLEETAQKALGQLSTTLGASQAALVATAERGTRALAVGDPDLLSAAGDEHRPDRLTVQASESGLQLTAMFARQQPPFTAFERQIAHAGLTTMQRWVNASLRSVHQQERRRRFQPVDRLFDQIAAEAVGAGQQASVIVVSAGAFGADPERVLTWLNRIRGQLRGGDFTGLLNDTEIAILLCDTSKDQADVVCARVQRMMEPGDSLKPAFGATTWSPASRFEGSLVAAARAGAALAG